MSESGKHGNLPAASGDSAGFCRSTRLTWDDVTQNG
jgi:hypothetical protein